MGIYFFTLFGSRIQFASHYAVYTKTSTLVFSLLNHLTRRKNYYPFKVLFAFRKIGCREGGIGILTVVNLRRQVL